jgi:ADP-ribose pyrophosphatase
VLRNPEDDHSVTVFDEIGTRQDGSIHPRVRENLTQGSRPGPGTECRLDWARATAAEQVGLTGRAQHVGMFRAGTGGIARMEGSAHMAEWLQLDEEHVADMRIFDVTRRTLRNPRNGRDRAIARIQSPDWVNVVAVTKHAEIVLVRQWRHGTEHVTLEIPGGMVDPGEAPADAAVRELREETGFSGGTVSELGVVEPNPAFMSNRCHTYLVENCARTDARRHISPMRRLLPLQTVRAQCESSFWFVAGSDSSRRCDGSAAYCAG